MPKQYNNKSKRWIFKRKKFVIINFAEKTIQTGLISSKILKLKQQRRSAAISKAHNTAFESPRMAWKTVFSAKITQELLKRISMWYIHNKTLTFQNWLLIFPSISLLARYISKVLF
jgi:hypothetical protein